MVDSPWLILAPAPELRNWERETFLASGGNLCNEDHDHLACGDIEFLWASTAFAKAGCTVLGQCEQVIIRAGRWQ